MTNAYILAPHTEDNFAVLQQVLQQFPEIVEERRVKFVYARSPLDIVDAEGALLVPADAGQFIYLCADAAPDSPLVQEWVSMCEQASVYSIDTQPFSEYWLS